MTDTRGEQPGPGQRWLDRRAAEGLEWARWAVRRWSAFPVGQAPRPLVLVESRVRVEKGFKTGEAKMAFLEGRVESSVAVPAAVLDGLARQGRPDLRRSGRPLLITEASCWSPDHRAFATTEGYCRIRQDRRRQAVALERRWQWDAHGNELEQIIERFAESEDARLRLGSTAIPYGSCVEPSNVAARAR